MKVEEKKFSFGMRIAQIRRFCAKLRALEKHEKLPKMIELPVFGKNC